MLITILDNSISYSSETINRKPLGSSQKCVINLSVALANRGHTVKVVNKIKESIFLDGVLWSPLDDSLSITTDILIVHQDPELFKYVLKAKKKFLWLTSTSDLILRKKGLYYAHENKPIVLCQGERHGIDLPKFYQKFNNKILVSGVSDCFFSNFSFKHQAIPRALVTTHPLLGLEWLLDLWKKDISVKIPWAELHIYSYLLSKGPNIKVSDEINIVSKKARDMNNEGVKIKTPLVEIEMANEIKNYRVHIYPSHNKEVNAATLAETQSLGLPAVARPLGAVPEKMTNGITGYMTLDEKQFTDYIVRLLSDDSLFKKMSKSARESKRKRKWSIVAEEFEAYIL